jgi:hypothetical protein
LVPHAPQLFGSDAKVVQRAPAPEPHAFGVAVGQLHMPVEHCWPRGQTLPHTPQFWVSVCSLAQ